MVIFHLNLNFNQNSRPDMPICYRLPWMESRFANKMLSVVSKSGLGYVGKLHAIDTKHCTVTLSKGNFGLANFF